jgi:ubiquitin-conjugating enzyme E2 J2
MFKAPAAPLVTSQEAMLCRRRVMKEYEDLMTTKIPHVHIAKDENNHLDWYCLIHGLDDPYLDGEFIFKIQLSPRYPLAPPDFYFLTPNGRFELNKKLCFSNSSYHGETWSPIWTIRTIVLGFLSFFLEESSKGVGHLSTTKEVKRGFATSSKAHNETHLASVLAMIRTQNNLLITK